MRLNYRLLPLFILLISLYIGCADDITQTGNTVTVHLNDIYGFDYPSSNYVPNISIGDYPVALTDLSGYRSFSNVTKPYNITTEGTGIYFLFRNLSISNPSIVAAKFNEPYGGVACRTCFFRVNMQMPEDFHIAILHFISKDWFFETLDIITPYFGVPHGNVNIPAEVDSISGKLVLMYCEGDFVENSAGLNTLTIFSYDSIAVKDITLHPGEDNSVSFSHHDMITSLHQTDISYSAESYYVPHNEAYLSFPGYSSCSDIMIYRNADFSSLFPVITNLPIPFEIKMRSVFGNSSISLQPQVIGKGSPGTEFLLQHKEIELIEPPHGQTGVNDNTLFRFCDNIEQGIYAIEIAGKYLTFTNNTEITFGELKSRLFLPKKGKTYNWRVFKISEFNDINDFLSEPYNFSSKLSRISISDARNFRTAE